MILVALSVALAEEVAQKKTEKRWIYGSGYGSGGYGTGAYGTGVGGYTSGYGSGYNNAYGLSGSNQAYNQYGMTNEKKNRLFFTKWKFHAY